jgi:hypothetical protein
MRSCDATTPAISPVSDEVLPKPYNGSGQKNIVDLLKGRQVGVKVRC